MIFKNIIINNFGPFKGKYKIPLLFDGIALVIAENRIEGGSNGSGKSSIKNAIRWCLFGKSIGKIDTVINFSIEKNCSVEINMEDKNHLYKIIRYRKDDIHENTVLIYKDGEEISPKNIKDKNKFIEELININIDSFNNSICFDSKIENFLKLTPQKRFEVWKKLLHLENLDLWIENSKELIKEKRQLKDRVIDKYNVIEINHYSYLQKIDFNIKSIKEEIEELQKEENILLKIDFDLKISNLEKELEKNIKEEVEVSKIKEKIEEINERNKLLENNLNEKKEIESLLLDIPIEEKIKEDIEKLNKEIIKIEIESNNEKEIENKIFEIKSLSDDNENNKIKLKKEIRKLKEKLQSLSKKLKKIEENPNICFNCNQIIEKEKWENDINDVNKEINKTNEEKENLINSLKELKEEEFYKNKVNILNEELSKIINNKEIYKEIDKEINYKNKLLNSRLKLQKNLDKINLDIYNINDFLRKNNIDDLNIKLNEYHLNNDINNIKKELEQLRNKKSRLQSVSAIIKEKKNVIQNQEKEKEERVNNFNEINKKHKEEVNKLVKEIENSNRLLELLKNKIKPIIIEKILNTFNKYVNKYLGYFFKTASINFNKKLEEKVEIYGKQISVELLSSGQITAFDLSILFASFKISNALFSEDSNLLIIDEALDMFMDNIRMQAVIEILKEEFNNTILITHQDDYKKVFDDKIIKVIMKKDANSIIKLTGEWR